MRSLPGVAEYKAKKVGRGQPSERPLARSLLRLPYETATLSLYRQHCHLLHGLASACLSRNPALLPIADESLRGENEGQVS